MKKVLLVALVAITTMSMTSCATLFGKKTHELSVGSNPGGVEVYVNGVYHGITPLTLNLKADKTYTVEYRKDGYIQTTRQIHSQVSAGWVVLDILGGVIPVVIDAATGNWNKLSADSVTAVMVQKEQP